MIINFYTFLYYFDNLLSLKNPLHYLQLKIKKISNFLNFYQSKKFGASFLYDVSNSLTAKIGLNHENQKALFDYQYQNLGNQFKNVSTTLSLKYSPNDKNMMTPGGKLTYEKKFPQFFLNYEMGSKRSRSLSILLH